MKKYVYKATMAIIFTLFMVAFMKVPVSAATSNNWAWPTTYHTIKNDWPRYSSGSYHSGTDFPVALNTPVYSTCDGTVVAVTSLTTSYGKHIKIRATVNGNTVYMRYCHLNSFAISNGAEVKAGQLIGYSGSTGNSTGPHLHYEVRNANDYYGNANSPTLDPRNYLPGSDYRYEVSGVTGHNPEGGCDITGVTGGVQLRGWTIDKDLKQESLKVHVYIGGPAGVGEGHITTANRYRPDIPVNLDDAALGNYHGIDDIIYTQKTGQQEIYVYAINVGNGSDNTLLSHNTITINADTEAPKITDVKVFDITKDSYTLSFKATDNVTITKIWLPTWTTANDQDDILDEPVTKSGDIYTIIVNRTNHKNECGPYTTHIYVYDYAGNYRTATSGLVTLQHYEVIDPAVAATCTEEGKTEGKHCSVCKAVIAVQTTIPAKGHTWDEGVVTKEATCTQDGVRTYTCGGCGKRYTEAIRAKGHSYAESVTEATCTERGYTTHTCSACGDSYRNLYVDALGHQFDQGVVTKAPTGDTDGIRTYTCSRCHTTREETIPATGHTYDNGTVTKEATCTETGIRTYRCSDCGRTYTEEIPSLGHRYETAVTAPSCTKKGYTTHTCTACGDSYKDSYTDAVGHSYNDGEVAEEATCTEEGLKIYTCVNCRNQYTELITASGHQYEERVTAPSCTKKGYTTHTCTVCRYSYKDDYTNALGHDYDEGEVVEEPSCTEEGLQRYTCLRCQNQYTETIAAAGHQYVSIVTEPGCTEKGYTAHTCTACGESYQDSYVNATGHDYDEGEVVEEPTCTKEGLQRYTCLRCQNQYTETIAAAGHRWNNGEIITAATASSTGRKMYICGECGEKKIETIPALSDEKEQKPSNPETNTPPQGNQTEYRPAAGETVSVGGSRYRVTASGKTVEYAGCLMDGITFIGIPKKVVLHGVTYPVTGIADRAFAKNQTLMTVFIPEGVRVIGDSAFESCKSLKKVTIPSSVEKIGKRAFYGCRRLVNLTIQTKKLTKKKVGEKAFTKAGSASYKKLKVKVPKAKKKAYKGLLKKKGLSPKAKMK